MIYTTGFPTWSAFRPIYYWRKKWNKENLHFTTTFTDAPGKNTVWRNAITGWSWRSLIDKTKFGFDTMMHNWGNQLGYMPKILRIEMTFANRLMRILHELSSIRNRTLLSCKAYNAHMFVSKYFLQLNTCYFLLRGKGGIYCNIITCNIITCNIIAFKISKRGAFHSNHYLAK